MRSLRNLEINQSIERGKLVYDESFMDKFDGAINYLISFLLIFISICLSQLNTQSENDFTFEIIFAILSGTFGLYNLYRKLMEKRLIKIKSRFSAKEIKEKLLDFAIKEEYEIYRQSGYCLIFNSSDWEIDLYKKTRIIFIRDYEIYFTVIQDNSRLNRPVYTTHLFLKRAFKKLLN
ncbi:hypothetical protein F0919_03745 [Taibaiella lutea]|uniref:Uncharacterized protein n=1 Tax=Taibaiella lutea TaxID=2608001 RepID=A0A5M6CUV7_9BACT|nr:hypothetical protein [Taibaiella lutea]KAA5536795.1 hypothetical protein F0919_03745 [Taibaiella lutea]